jgi:hypothetical protein
MLQRLDRQRATIQAQIRYENSASMQRAVQLVEGVTWENIPEDHRIPFVIMGKNRYERSEWVQILTAWECNMSKKISGYMDCIANRLSLHDDGRGWSLNHISTWDHMEEHRPSSKKEAQSWMKSNTVVTLKGWDIKSRMEKIIDLRNTISKLQEELDEL